MLNVKCLFPHLLISAGYYESYSSVICISIYSLLGFLLYDLPFVALLVFMDINSFSVIDVVNISSQTISYINFVFFLLKIIPNNFDKTF